MSDWAEREGDFIKADFLNGALHERDFLSLATASGKAIAWSDVRKVDYEEIEAFYAKENRQDTDTTTAV